MLSEAATVCATPFVGMHKGLVLIQIIHIIIYYCIVFGFHETSFVGFEREGSYTVEFGFLSGSSSTSFEVTFQLNLVTAGKFNKHHIIPHKTIDTTY